MDAAPLTHLVPATLLLENLRPVVGPAEVVRHLGYPAGANPDAGILKRIYRAVDRLRLRQRPCGGYAIHRVVRDAETMELYGGFLLPSPARASLAGSRRVAAFLATAGSEVSMPASEAWRPGSETDKLILDAIGSALVEAAAACVVEDLRRHLEPGEELSQQYSPGFCGASLEDQRLLFQLLDGPRMGIELLGSNLMKPVKSVSGLIGMGPSGVVRPHGNPCDICPLETCAMRRSK